MKIDLPTLGSLQGRCLVYASDGAVSAADRDQFRNQGAKLLEAMQQLASKEFKSDTPELLQANKELKEANERLSKSKKVLDDIAGHIQLVANVASLLDSLIVLVVGAASAMPSRSIGRKGVKRVFNCLSSPDTDNDWSFRNAVASKSIQLHKILPASVDLRASWWKVGNQGQTGSCVGWATADGLLRWHFVKSGKIKKTELLSPRYVWMAAKETDEYSVRPTTFIDEDGTWLKAALDVARKYGVVRESLLEFSGCGLFVGNTNDFYATAAQLKINSYFNIRRQVDEWKKWLAFNGPLLVRLDCDDSWMALENQPDGILDEYHRPESPAGHAVLIVGYTSTHFIVRNSWDTGWGSKGFAYASYKYALAAFTESYGVSL